MDHLKAGQILFHCKDNLMMSYLDPQGERVSIPMPVDKYRVLEVPDGPLPDGAKIKLEWDCLPEPREVTVLFANIKADGYCVSADEALSFLIARASAKLANAARFIEGLTANILNLEAQRRAIKMQDTSPKPLDLLPHRPAQYPHARAAPHPAPRLPDHSRHLRFDS